MITSLSSWRHWSTSLPWKERTNCNSKHLWMWISISEQKACLVDKAPWINKLRFYFLSWSIFSVSLPLSFLCQSSLPIQGYTHHTKLDFFLAYRLSLTSLSSSEKPEGQSYSALCTLFLRHSLYRNSLIFIKQVHQPKNFACYLRHTFLVKREVHLSSFCVCIWKECTGDGWRHDECGCISLCLMKYTQLNLEDCTHLKISFKFVLVNLRKTGLRSRKW